MKKIVTHYSNLNIAESASQETIKAAYRRLSQKWHPDRNRNQPDKAAQNFIIINKAYQVLSDPIKRQQHDAWIRSVREPAKASPPPYPPPNPAWHEENTAEHETLLEPSVLTARMGRIAFFLSSPVWLTMLFWIGVVASKQPSSLLLNYKSLFALASVLGITSGWLARRITGNLLDANSHATHSRINKYSQRFSRAWVIYALLALMMFTLPDYVLDAIVLLVFPPILVLFVLWAILVCVVRIIDVLFR